MYIKTLPSQTIYEAPKFITSKNSILDIASLPHRNLYILKYILIIKYLLSLGKSVYSNVTISNNMHKVDDILL
jgi:hypothetical protein